MTNQEAFDVMVRHLRKQGRQARRDIGGPCRYRAENGLKCAVGALIPDDEYSRSLEFHGVGEIYADVPSLQSIALDLLEEMQMIHDHDQVSTWEDSFSAAAKRLGLTLPPLEGEVPNA